MPELTSSPLLIGLPDAAVQDFAAAAEIIRVPALGTIFDEGEPGDRVFLVISGKVKVTRPGDDGKDNVFTIAGAGDLLGELSMFDGAVRLATARAVRLTQVAWLSNDRMRDWLERHPEASRRFMRILIARIRYQNDALEDIYGLDVGTRVARAVIRQGSRFGRRTTEGLRLDIGLSQEELALHVRASRESVNQALSAFSRHGWIRREGAELIILDEEALTRQAHYTPPPLPRMSLG